MGVVVEVLGRKGVGWGMWLWGERRVRMKGVEMGWERGGKGVGVMLERDEGSDYRRRELGELVWR